MSQPRLWLASASPRRRHFLAEHGFIAECVEPDLDDASLHPRRAKPAHWAVAMAMFKAARVREMIRFRERTATGWIIAADTVCDLDDRIIGKPRDGAECREFLRLFSGRMHRVRTGVCLLDVADGDSHLLLDTAEVTLGELDGAEIDRYVATNEWEGKAGGYNYSERLEGGWSLECVGDPTSVMGLPMKRLVPRLRSLLTAPAGAPRC